MRLINHKFNNKSHEGFTLYVIKYACMQILVVEDEPKIGQFIKKGLKEERYSVDLATDGRQALDQLEINNYDLMVLDIMIPVIDGYEVCRQVRKFNTNLPIIMLTAKDTVEDKVMGLDSGADDYLSKPFSFAELTARIRALLRRGQKAADPVILTFEDLTLNPASKIVTRAGKSIDLTAREYALLEYFMRNQGIVLTKTQLLEHVWEYSYDGLSNIVETYVKYLRKKIQIKKDSKELIHTRRGSGYIFTSDV